MNDSTPLFDFYDRFSPVTHADWLLNFILRWMFIVSLAIFVIFGFVLIRQVRMMGQTIKTPLEPLLTLVAWAYFLTTIGVFIFALLVL